MATPLHRSFKSRGVDLEKIRSLEFFRVKCRSNQYLPMKQTYQTADLQRRVVCYVIFVEIVVLKRG